MFGVFCALAFAAGPPTTVPDRGDVNLDCGIDISDVNLIIDHLVDGEDLPCMDSADADADGDVDHADFTLLFQYVLFGGPAPSDKEIDC